MINRIPKNNPYRDKENFIKESIYASLELPINVREMLEGFKRYGNEQGYIVLKNMPTDPNLMRTPVRHKDVLFNKKTFFSEFSLAVIGSYLGYLYAYKQESEGSYFSNIRPSPKCVDLQSSESSNVFLELHTEIAFHAIRPDFILLYCLRQDRDKVARTGISCIRSAMRDLDKETINMLRKNIFTIGIDYSFTKKVEDKSFSKDLSILSGRLDDPFMVYDSDLIKSHDKEAKQAQMKLDKALRNNMQYITLEPGDLVIIDNRRCVHSRTQFKAYYDGFDRWLQRSFTKIDSYEAELLYEKKLDVIDNY